MNERTHTYQCTQCDEILVLPAWAEADGRQHHLKMDDHENQGCGPLKRIVDEPDHNI